MRDPYITKITKNKQQDFKDFQQKGQSKFFDLVILNVIWNHIDVETPPLNPFYPSLTSLHLGLWIFPTEN